MNRLHIRSVVMPLLLACAVLTSSQGYSGPIKAQALELLIQETLDNNPQIQAAQKNWEAAEYRIRSVKGLPDPMVNYGYFGKSVETRVGPQKNRFGASQKIPFPGKLGTKGDAQGKHAEMLREKYEAVKREVVKNIKFIYYDIFWIDKAIQIAEEEKSVLESMENSARRRYESNLAPLQDVIKVQVEITKTIDKLLSFRQHRKSSVAKINSILNRQERTTLDEVSDIVITEFAYSIDQLHEYARDSRQELLAANLDVERAEYEKSLAQKEYLPDFTFGFDYIQVGSGRTTMYNDGQDAWIGTVAVNVPIWFDRIDAQVKEKNAGLESAKSRHEDMKNSVKYEVEDLYFKITTYKETISLYKVSLIPQAEQSFEASMAGYEAGKVDFLNWLDAERVYLQTKLAYYKTVADYMKSIAYLERVVGRDL